MFSLNKLFALPVNSVSSSPIQLSVVEKRVIPQPKTQIAPKTSDRMHHKFHPQNIIKSPQEILKRPFLSIARKPDREINIRMGGVKLPQTGEEDVSEDFELIILSDSEDNVPTLMMQETKVRRFFDLSI